MAQGMFRRIAILVFATLALSACGSLHNPSSFWRGSEYWNSADPADLALAAIERGDFSTAKRHADEARRRNPQDPYGLFASALVYQNTGQPQMAYDFYQSILSVSPNATITVGSNGALKQRSLVDVARENLAALKKANPGLTGSQAMTSFIPPVQGRQQVPARSVDGIPVGAGTIDWGIPLETNRLLTLKNLYDRDLVTEGEYKSRLDANRGYALPFSNSTPPAAGLERTAPGVRDVSERLKAIAVNMEKGITTSGQHASERAAILDGLLPATPGPAGSRPPAPTPSELTARRTLLNALLQAGIITPDEMARELGAMDAAVKLAAPKPVPVAEPKKGSSPKGLLPAGKKSQVSKAKGAGTDLTVQPRLGAKSGQTSALVPPVPKSVTPPASSLPEFKAMEGCTMGVHLSSMSSEVEATQEWVRLQGKYPQLLGKLTLSVTRTDQGPKGIFYQIKGGPLDVATAGALCKALKAQAADQYCEVGNF